MDNWLKERETWTATCRRLQGDISSLTHTISLLENKLKTIQQVHEEILLEKNKIHNELDQEILRLTDENKLLTLELSCKQTDCIKPQSYLKFNTFFYNAIIWSLIGTSVVYIIFYM